MEDSSADLELIIELASEVRCDRYEDREDAAAADMEDTDVGLYDLKTI